MPRNDILKINKTLLFLYERSFFFNLTNLGLMSLDKRVYNTLCYFRFYIFPKNLIK